MAEAPWRMAKLASSNELIQQILILSFLFEINNLHFFLFDTGVLYFLLVSHLKFTKRLKKNTAP